MINDVNREYIVIGASGHGAVVADILLKSGLVVKGFLDDGVEVGSEVLGVPVLGAIDMCTRYPDCLFIVGIGNNATRRAIAEKYQLDYGVAVHPSAIIGQDVEIGAGSVLMASCVVNPMTVIGEHCIINTGACLDHDNKISDFVHVSPGAVLGGLVNVGCGSQVGIGACVKNVTTICDDVIVGAGAVVVKDITEPGVYYGVPARLVPKMLKL